MAKDSERFGSTSNKGVSENGAGAELTFTREDGQSLHLRFYKDDFPRVIEELTELAIEAAARRTGSHTIPISNDLSFRNIEVNQLAVARSGDADHLFLVLRFFDFDLSYKVDLEDLRTIADGFAQTVEKIDSEGLRAPQSSFAPDVRLIASALITGNVRLGFFVGQRETEKFDATPDQIQQHSR